MRILLSAHSWASYPEVNQIACLPFSRMCELLNAETQESPAGVSRDAKAVVWGSHTPQFKEDPLLSYALFWNLQAKEKTSSHPRVIRGVEGRETPAVTQMHLEGIMLKEIRQTHIRPLHGSASMRDLE